MVRFLHSSRDEPGVRLSLQDGAHFVKCVEFRSRCSRMRILGKNCLRSCCGVDDEHWNVSQLDLIDWPVFARPVSVLQRRVLALNLPQVPNNGKARWSTELRNPCRPSNTFVDEEADDRDSGKSYCIELRSRAPAKCINDDRQHDCIRALTRFVSEIREQDGDFGRTSLRKAGLLALNLCTILQKENDTVHTVKRSQQNGVSGASLYSVVLPSLGFGPWILSQKLAG